VKFALLSMVDSDSLSFYER